MWIYRSSKEKISNGQFDAFHLLGEEEEEEEEKEEEEEEENELQLIRKWKIIWRSGGWEILGKNERGKFSETSGYKISSIFSPRMGITEGELTHSSSSPSPTSSSSSSFSSSFA